MPWFSSLAALVLVLSAALASQAVENSAADWLRSAAAAWDAGDKTQAMKLADQAVQRFPDHPEVWFRRAGYRAEMEQHAHAIADLDEALKRKPNWPEAYERRGSEHFKRGEFAASLADFDKQLALAPAQLPGHWKRGITCYYLGKYDEGRKQFESYQNVDGNDVENAVWRYLCMARSASLEKARAEILQVGEDRRVPMRTIYELFAGRVQPGEVLRVARAGEPTPQELNQRLFYAHLYLGLHFECEGRTAQALEHLKIAAEQHRIGHYMWDVARVHAEMLAKKPQ
jgi:lipoprotein NlpI